MNRNAASIRFPSSVAAPAQADAHASHDDSDALLSTASDDDLELALRLVAWNQRDLGQFLKTRTPR